MKTRTVETAVTLRFVDAGGRGQIDATLRYRTDHPMAVELEFPATDERQAHCWRFSRSLLARGMDFAAGIGDVEVWPWGRRFITLALRSPDGRADLRVDRGVVGGFLKRTFRACPPDQESVVFSSLFGAWIASELKAVTAAERRELREKARAARRPLLHRRATDRARSGPWCVHGCGLPRSDSEGHWCTASGREEWKRWDQ